MKLYYSNTSPYSRKVRLVIREKNLESQVEEVLVNPFGEETKNKLDLLVANPLGKIPTLVLDDGRGLYDSPVICQYLDSLSDRNIVTPKNINQRLNVLRWEAMTDGLTDATYNIAIERKRPPNEQSSDWIKRWSIEIKRTLLHIEKCFSEITSETDKPTLAHFGLASAISYLELRYPEALHDIALPESLAWYETFKSRTAMEETQLLDLT